MSGGDDPQRLGLGAPPKRYRDNSRDSPGYPIPPCRALTACSTRSDILPNTGDVWCHAMDDKRNCRRNRVLKEGRIVFNAGSSVLSCVIRDQTERGAKLRMPAQSLLDVQAQHLFEQLRLVWPTIKTREIGS